MNETTTVSLETKVFDSIESLLDESRQDEALELNIRVYEEALANDDSYYIANCLYFFGYFEDKKSEPQRAMAFYKKATALARRNNYNKCLVKTLNNRGSIYMVSGKIHSAISKYTEALNLTTNVKELADYRMKILNNLALIYIDIENYKHASEYFFECMKLAKENQQLLLLTTVYGNLCDMYYQQDKMVKAKYYNKLAQEISEKIPDLVGLAICQANKGVFANYEGLSWIEANHYFEHALEIINSENAEVDKEDILLKYGKTAFKAGKLEKAEELLASLAKKARDNTYFKIEEDALIVLKKVYEKFRDYEKAYVVSDRLLELKNRVLELLEEGTLENISLTSDTSTDSDVEGLQKSIKTLKLLSEIGQKITACKSEDDIYEVLKMKVADIIGYDGIGIGITAKNKIKIDYKFFDENGEQELDISIYDDEYLMSTCIRHGKDIIVYDTKDNVYNEANFSGKLLYIIKHSDTRGILFTPIKYGDRTIGGITIQTYERGKLSYVDLESLRVLSSYIAIAFSNIEATRELQVANKKFEEASMLDGLTGVYNRHALGQYIGREFIGMLEKKIPATALMIDIDFFKQFNDNYGHIKGDYCLKKICSALRNSLSGHAHRLFRYGGDEFFVLIEQCDLEKAKGLLDKIFFDVAMLNIPHKYSKVSDRVTLTIGATVIEKPVRDYTLVFTKSDEALYEAKDGGRNRYSINIT